MSLHPERAWPGILLLAAAAFWVVVGAALWLCP